MVWRETFPPANELSLDVEAERERRLAAQARAGADWALTALIARYQPTVTRYLTRLCGDQVRAREMAERVFQRMERRLHGPHGAENLRLWLLRASTEAGLEALRRPRRPQAPRLEATRVAGLLPEESGDGARGVLEDGIKRLKNVVGAVGRQARPLVWQVLDAATRAPATGQTDEGARKVDKMGPVDEALDTLDPREALRHRLVRLTLAELPYGDAQCLALHLVAGLNQAEVARALGITNSAARKRIVQGLSQFSVHYQVAVRALGLPEELGYGDAMARRIEEERPVFSRPDPEPVIVSQTPELELSAAQPAPSTVPLAVDTFDDVGEITSGVAYYAASSPGAQTTYTSPPGPDYFAPADVGEYSSPFEAAYDSPFAEYSPGVTDEFDSSDSPFTEPFTESYIVAPYEAALASEPEMQRDAEVQEGMNPDRLDAQYPNAGYVTRIAADAIVGPVVDALPVHSEPLVMATDFGAPSSQSTPLGYELDSGDAELGGMTMNWIDSTGMMEPLSFEAIVTPTSLDADAVSGDDPWARSTVLEFVTPVGPASTVEDAENTDDDVSSDDSFSDDIAAEALDAPLPPLDMRIALDEGDYGWERSQQGAATPEHGDSALASDALPLAEQVSKAPFDEYSFADAPDPFDLTARPTPPVTRTLEDLWDETPDTFGR